MRQEQRTQQPWTVAVEVLSALVAWNMTVRLGLRALVARQRRRVGTALLLALFLLGSTLGLFVQNGGVAMAAPVARGPQPGTGAQPTNTSSSANLTDLGKRVIVLPQTKGHTATSAQATTSPSPIARPTGITMKSATISLSASASATHATTLATTWTSSDQRLTVTVPAGAVTPALLTAGSGGVSLQVKQLAGASGGMGMGASGRISLGTYQFSLIGSHGPIHAALAKPISLSLSLKGWQGAGFDLSHVIFVVDGSAPVSAYLDTTTGKLNTALVSAKPQPFVATLNRTAGSLDVAIPLAGSGTTNGTWNTDSPQAHWDAQADTGVDLSSGDLTYSYPLDVPPGPGGLTPNLTMSYDSSSVANEHNPQATSGWLGEGWNMSLGSITWGEHNVYTSNNCTFSNCTCTLINCTIWDNMWQFSDAFGNGGQLIPQDSNVSPWYDDSIHGQVPTPNEPIAWNVASEPRIKIESYTNPTANNNFPSQYYPTQPPCFRVFLPNGSMEEFGCTVDSLEYYVDQNPFSSEYKGNYISSWNLDMIVDPNGNQIHVTYNRYENYDKVDGATQFPIDAVPATVTYDSPSCHSTTTMCTGSSWQPQAQIVFNSATAAARLTGAVCPTFQNTTTYLYGQTMRCDDVQDLSHNTPAGLASPALQSLAILNDVQVQVSTSGSSPAWKTLRDYKFSYDQSAATTTPSATPDPVSGQVESIAGHLVLTKIQEMGDDTATTLPPLTMTYTPQVETYVDTLSLPAPTTNCGPTWNTYSGCPLWSEFTGYYLTDMTNGQGWDETYTYALAHNNTHGVNTGLTLEDPLTCNGANESSSPCKLADDENWSKYVVTQRQASVQCVLANGTGCGSNHTAYLTSTTSYTYRLTDLVGKECSGCAAGMYWGNQNDGDTLDFYNATFMGFHTTQVSSPDGSQQLYTFESGDGYGIADSQINCYANFNIPCTVVPWTDSANFLHGQVIEEDDYDTNGTTLLKKTTSSFVSGATACPPNGISGSPYNATDPHGHFVGQRTSELDINNPVTVCEIEPAQSVTSVYDGNTSHVDTTTADTYTYDGSGHMTTQTQDTAASDASQTPHVTQKTQFTWHDAITTSGTSASGVYFNMLAGIQTTEDGSGNVKACAYTGYDGGTVGATGSVSTLSKGLVTEATRYATNCTPGSLSGPVSTIRTYNTNGDLLATQDADAVAGVSGHTTTACAYNSINYTACAAYDSLYASQVASVENDLNQTSGLGYQDTSSSSTTPDPVNGWGQWLTSMTDANSQKTLYEYDPLGRLTAIAKPGAAYGDTYSSPTTSYAYPITCAATGAQEPCADMTTTQRLSGSDTTTSATYYDGWGRAVETVTPSSLSGTTCTVSVSYTEYDASGRKAFVSDPYFQTIANDASCTPSYLRPDSTQPGTTTLYDGLGRVISTEDALSAYTTTTYSVGAPTGGANITDSALYAATATLDANSHQTRTLVDGLGHTRYVEHFTGTHSSGFALYGTVQQNDDWLGNVVSVYEPNVGGGGAGLSTTAQTTTTYNLISQATTTSDADLGSQTATYDANGNVTETVDARGAAGTVFVGYDGLNRQLWRNTTNTPTGAYVTYTYDQTTGHGFGVGHVTTEAFTNSGGTHVKALSGSHAYTYDERGQVTSQGETYDAHGYTFGMAYNDAGQPTSLTYSDLEVLATGYNAFGWLNQVQTTPSGKATTTLATNVGYTGNAGAAMQPTSASIGANGTYTYTASFDNDLRLTTDSLTTSSATLYSATRGYDAVGNVVSEDTQLGSAANTDNQLFCYDEQNRLVWAGATGTSPCNGAVSSGTLTTAYYSQAYGYDAQGRLTSATLGSYTYGDPNHPHAVTAIGSGAYSASYDAAGDMTCRAPSSSVTCSGVPTGATLAYDAERRLAQWQNQPSSPTVEADYLYDGEGQRVEQWVSTNGVQTTTGYLMGGLEERASTGTITTYLGAKGLPMAIRVGSAGSLNYLATDGLNSVSVAVDGSGNLVASQLYAPYGTARYSNGTMPTSKGFTGQRADATSGLDYYGARYYDPVAGQFASADSVQYGLARYAYVGGNPETATDPSGHLVVCGTCGNGGGPGGNGYVPPAPPGGYHCYSNCGRTPPPPGVTGNNPGLGGTTPPAASPSDPEVSSSCTGACKAQHILSSEGNTLSLLGAAIAGIGLIIAFLGALILVDGGVTIAAGILGALETVGISLSASVIGAGVADIGANLIALGASIALLGGVVTGIGLAMTVNASLADPSNSSYWTVNNLESWRQGELFAVGLALAVPLGVLSGVEDGSIVLAPAGVVSAAIGAVGLSIIIADINGTYNSAEAALNS